MPVLICPECGELNPLEAESCTACQASLADVSPTEEPAQTESIPDDFDLFAVSDADLPDLLESLKQDNLSPEGDELAGFDLEAGPEQLFPEYELSGDMQAPDWLDVVRKRAREEEDAVGDLIKRVSDAQEHLEQDKRQSQHEDFENWIQKLRDEARDKAAGGVVPEEKEPDLPPEEEEEDEPKWLSRLRKTHGGLEDKSETDAAGRSLLEWLVELEDQRTAGEAAQDNESTQQISLPSEDLETDATQEIRISAVQQGKPLSTLELTREDREQADQLKAVIADETADRPQEAHPIRKPLSILDIFVGLGLIVGIVFMLMTGRGVNFSAPLLPISGQAVLDWVSELPEDADVLIVFDYQPAYTAEIERIAKPVFSELFVVLDAVDVIESSASGLLLSKEIFTDYPNLAVTDIGYYPGEAYGAFGLASGLISGSRAENLSNYYAGILILSNQFESAQGWVEQWQVLAPETPLHLLVAAQAGPLLQPYLDSGQISGMVSGLSGAVAVEAALGQSGEATSVWQAYQLGILILVGVLILGTISGVGSGRHSDARGGR